jgi:hypothetical protein
MLVVAAAGTLAAVVSVDAALEILRIALGAGVGLVVFPLGIGTALVRRVAGVDRDRALRVTTATWPIGLLVSFLVYIAPGGPYRYNITFLSGNEAVAAFVVWGACILLLPGILGIIVLRLRGD